MFSGHKDEQHDYLLCNNLPTLLWLAQSGTLEFHVWHSRAKLGPDARSQEHRLRELARSARSARCSTIPTTCCSTSIPYIYSGKEAQGAEPELNTVAFEKGKEVAFWLRELLQSMSLEAIVKTSGKTGLHVFVPIRRTIDFDAARHVSELVGRHLMRLHPKDITLEWSVPKRTGKIFMDYNMNVRGKTLNVAYSPRGEPGAPVSMPLTWEELASAHPLDFTITNARAAAGADGRPLERRARAQAEPRKARSRRESAESRLVQSCSPRLATGDVALPRQRRSRARCPRPCAKANGYSINPLRQRAEARQEAWHGCTIHCEFDAFRSGWCRSR